MGILERDYMKRQTDAEDGLLEELAPMQYSPPSSQRVDPFKGMVLQNLPSSEEPSAVPAPSEKNSDHLIPSHATVKASRNEFKAGQPVSKIGHKYSQFYLTIFLIFTASLIILFLLLLR